MLNQSGGYNTAKGKKGYQSVNLADRLAEKIMPEPMSGCWLWLGAKTGQGYGQIWFDGKNKVAHRAMYEIAKGNIPSDREIDHLCRNKCCVNPDHLEIVTHPENMLRAFAKKKNFCIKGHRFTTENTLLDKHGYRHCRACAKIRSDKFEARAALKKAGIE